MRVPTDVQSLLRELLHEHVCREVRVEGDAIVAEGRAGVDGELRSISLRIEASAIAASVTHHGETVAAAGALLTDTEEELHFAALESDEPLTVVLS